MLGTMTTVTNLHGADGVRGRIATEIRVLLVRSGKTQAELAAVIGVNQSQLSKRIRGAIPFNVDEVAAIADYFGVSVGDLFGEQQTPHRRGDDGAGSARWWAPRGSNPEPTVSGSGLVGAGLGCAHGAGAAA